MRGLTLTLTNMLIGLKARRDAAGLGGRTVSRKQAFSPYAVARRLTKVADSGGGAAAT